MSEVGTNQRLRLLELFCGIGGCAAAVADRAEIVAAVDINRTALEAYGRNFPHPTIAATIESLPSEWWRRWNADVWWMSPPCQPFTERGSRRDMDDPRTQALLAVIQRIGEVCPRYVALENVPGFGGSQTHGRLCEQLIDHDYRIRELLLCPTDVGVPNRRKRFYLIASRDRLTKSCPLVPASPRFTIADILEPAVERLEVSSDLVEQYRQALHLVDARDAAAETSCFTAAYGRSYVRSGSYLRTDLGVRRFSPREILRLLGFSDSFRLPEPDPRRAWPLVGNSLSLYTVREALSAIPELSCRPEPGRGSTDGTARPG